MRVWLDDVRTPPPGWVWVKTAAAAVDLLDSGGVEEISLDHDLGDGEPSGYVVAVFIEERAYSGSMKPLKWAVHSNNPSGRARIIGALSNAEKFWRNVEQRNP